MSAPPGGDTGTVLGLDAGTVRVGLAATDPTGTIATPVDTLARQSDRALWDRVRAEARERGATRIVVGLPLGMGGDEGPAAESARAFAAEVGVQTGLPVEMWDERLTSVAAERALVSSGMRRRRRREVADAVAEALMLQGWLDAHRPARR